MKIFGKHGQHYQSELDKFLREFDAKRQEQPVARLEEQAKAEAVAKRRDHRVTPQDGKVWEGF